MATEETRPWIIISGEMADVEYCSTYGPYASREAAEDDAQRLIALGHISIEPDDQLDYRVCELFLPAPGEIPTEVQLAETALQDEEEFDPELEAQFSATMDAYFGNSPGAGQGAPSHLPMPSHLAELLNSLNNGTETLGNDGPTGGLNPSVLEGLASGNPDFMRDLILGRMKQPDFSEDIAPEDGSKS